VEYRQPATPGEAFDEIDQLIPVLDYLRVYTDVERHPYGDTLRVNVEGVDPEGRQVDVDYFRPAPVDVTFVIDFADELPDELVGA
jgi:hypothetical protein